MQTETEKYQACLDYIKAYWDKITFYHPKDKGKHLGLPNRFVAPNNIIFKNDQFYWDSYFTILGLVRAGKIKLAKGMVENFVYLLKRFNIIPMRNRYYNLGTSQPPFLTSMAFEVFNYTKDTEWLESVMLAAEKELKVYWLNEDLTEKHIVYKGLCRYCDHYITHLGAEHESGWDMTSRFNDRCLHYLAVDLNSCLYKYEADLAKAWALAGNKRKAKKFLKHAETRKAAMNELLWNESQNFFCDYNYNLKEQSSFLSVAGFYPLWAGAATADQAERIVKYTLPLFETNGGIANTQPHDLSPEKKQHDYPNGWPHQQWIVVQGLRNYGYTTEAERIAKKWLDLNLKVFNETRMLWEKYNVVNCSLIVENSDRYILQSGFGWTNAVFLRFISDLNLSAQSL